MTTLTDDELLAWLDGLKAATDSPDDWQACDETAARFRELLALQEWQPIETAPKDGTEIDLINANDLMTGSWIDCWSEENSESVGSWYYCDNWEQPVNPTHWRHRPPPPKDG